MIFFTQSLGKLKSTYTINSINERIVATVAHSKPVATKKYDVDVAISEKKEKIMNNILYKT